MYVSYNFLNEICVHSLNSYLYHDTVEVLAEKKFLFIPTHF